MAQKAFDSLKNRVRVTLERGKAIAIVGWRDANHDEFTRSLSAEQVVFTSSLPPAHVAYTLFTKVVASQQRARISKGRSVSQMSLDTDQIKEILLTSKNLLRTQPKAGPAQASATSSPAADAHDQVLDFLTQPQRDLDTMEKFAAAFLLAASASPNELVGKRILGNLIKKHEAPNVPTLIAAGWIVGKIGEGKERVGWYEAGEKMRETEKKIAPLPDDPLDRARLLIANEDEVKAKKAEAEALVASCDSQLERIQQAKKLLAQLSELMKP